MAFLYEVAGPALTGKFLVNKLNDMGFSPRSFELDTECGLVSFPYHPVGLSPEVEGLMLTLLETTDIPIWGTGSVDYRPSDVAFALATSKQVARLSKTLIILGSDEAKIGASKIVLRGYVDAGELVSGRTPMNNPESSRSRRFLPVVFAFFTLTEEGVRVDNHPGVHFYYRDVAVNMLVTQWLLHERRTPHVPAIILAADCPEVEIGGYPPAPGSRNLVIISTNAGAGVSLSESGGQELFITPEVRALVTNTAYGSVVFMRFVFQQLWTLAALADINMVHNDIWLPNVLLATRDHTPEEFPLSARPAERAKFDHVYRVTSSRCVSVAFRPDRVLESRADGELRASTISEINSAMTTYLNLIDFDRSHISSKGLGKVRTTGEPFFNSRVHLPELLFIRRNRAGNPFRKHIQSYTARTDGHAMGLALIALILGEDVRQYLDITQPLSAFVKHAFPRRARDVIDVTDTTGQSFAASVHGVRMGQLRGTTKYPKWGLHGDGVAGLENTGLKNMQLAIARLTAFGMPSEAERAEFVGWSFLPELLATLEEDEDLRKHDNHKEDYAFWMYQGGWLWNSKFSPLVKHLGRGSPALDVLRQMTAWGPLSRPLALDILLPGARACSLSAPRAKKESRSAFRRRRAEKEPLSGAVHPAFADFVEPAAVPGEREWKLHVPE